ncbi:hypothetical protein IE81DRAFT_163192 [Ceraceosorus guamensis]|uniref:Uncharacterized protein n=1 Tax=Ceraceosorus guamensis TaxID=1522189 RepID=A0A316W6P2_9BASI|nr:hypothetical protein IE81DRAFT_163192 [Ceraceosorus guamensis]PWN45606.1 hypothetical protein IE81DRAFT_163192 [Ceraceosorus guamensis]
MRGGGGTTDVYGHQQPQAGPSTHDDALFPSETHHHQGARLSRPAILYTTHESAHKPLVPAFSLVDKDVPSSHSSPTRCGASADEEGHGAAQSSSPKRIDSTHAPPASQIHPWAAPFSLRVKEEAEEPENNDVPSAAVIQQSHEQDVYPCLAQETSYGAAPDEVPVHPAIHSFCSKRPASASWPEWKLNYAQIRPSRATSDGPTLKDLTAFVVDHDNPSMGQGFDRAPKPTPQAPKALAKAQLYAQETGTRLDLRALWAHRIRVEAKRRSLGSRHVPTQDGSMTSRVYLRRNVRWAKEKR